MSDLPPLGEGEEVEALHRALVREAAEPGEGRERAPWYLWVLVVISLFGGGWYLGRYSGPFDVTTHALQPGSQAPPEVVAASAGPAEGAAEYARCAACHGADGKGTPGVFPPLVGSEWVTGPPEIPVKIVLRGLTGPIEVAGAPYDSAMPEWGSQLDDGQIAAVVTHERRMAGVAEPLVPEDLVARLRSETADRKTPYTAAELQGEAP